MSKSTKPNIFARKEWLTNIGDAKLTKRQYGQIQEITDRGMGRSSTDIKNIALIARYHGKQCNISEQFLKLNALIHSGKYSKFVHNSELYICRFGEIHGPRLLKERTARRITNEQKLIEKLGVEKGKKRWNEFTARCSKNKTQERQVELYGDKLGNERWSNYKDKVKDWGTLDFFVGRYGTERGTAIFSKKMEALHSSTRSSAFQEKYGATWREHMRKAKANNALDILIEKHGYEAGTRRYNELCDQSRKRNTLEFYVERYGINLGTARYKNWKLTSAIALYTGYSKISQKLFNSIRDRLNIDTVQYGEYCGEFQIRTSETKVVYVDFIDHATKRVIEFYGDVWHANPSIYAAADVPNFVTKLSAGQIWAADDNRITSIKQCGYNVLITWEQDFNQDREATIQKCITYLTS